MTDKAPRKRLRRTKRQYRNRRILLAAVIAILMGLGVLLFSSLTAMRDVVISGTKVIPKTSVRQIADHYINKSYLSMDKKSLKNRLEQLPYVKEADIGLSFPHTLTIDIQEEKPTAQIYSGDGYILVNENFKALEKTRSYHTTLPKITGVPTAGIKLGQIAFQSTGNEKKIEMIRALFSSELQKDINTVAILDQGIKISFSDGTIVHIRSYKDADYKVKQLEEIRKEMKLKDETYREIFLDQGDHPIAVKPSSLDEEVGDEENNVLDENERDEKKDSKKENNESKAADSSNKEKKGSKEKSKNKDDTKTKENEQ